MSVRDQIRQKELELSVANEKLKEKEEMLTAITGEGGATAELLMELHQQTALHARHGRRCRPQFLFPR
jgi:hypothetical protein